MSGDELATVPEEIEVRTSDNTFRITWADGHLTIFKSRDLRILCHCAGCVDERTGARILDPASVPETIEPADMEEVGNYGLRIHWSSGHNTGIYTWDRLRAADPALAGGAEVDA